MSIAFPLELSKISIELKLFSLKTLEDRYYLAHERSPQELYWRCATAYSDDQAMAERMYQYFARQWAGPATPVLSNAPERVKFEKVFAQNFKADCFKNVLGPLPISCFLSTVGDSRWDIAQSYVEGIFLNSNGGGRGTHWSQLRELNCPTSTGQKTGGAIPFVGVSDRLVLATNQGSNRRGADMCNMDISHPEIEEFIQIRNPTGDNNRRSRNIHNGVNIPDDFMKRVIENADWDLVSPHTGKVVKTVKARKLWEMCLDTAATKGGEPMIHWVDASNRMLPQSQKDLGLEVNGSNLCVAPETMVLTDQGYKQIQTLAGQMVNIWNGEEWSLSAVAQTGEDQPLIKVTFSNGMSLYCTEYHRFEVLRSGYGSKAPIIKTASELVEGDSLPRLQLPVIQGEKELEMAYTNGFFSAEGCEYGGKQLLQIYGEKQKLRPYLEGVTSWNQQEDRSSVFCKGLKPKFFLPTADYSVESRLNWLAGLLDGDGCVARNGSNDSIQIASVEHEFIQQLLLMLQTLGVAAKISVAAEEGYRTLPDGKGGSRDYLCQKAYRLLINSNDTYHLLQLGLNCKRLVFKGNKPQRICSRFVTVVSVENDGRIDDTYCFNEPLKHRGFFNGINALNCHEITLPTNEDRTAVCCLSSLNMAKYNEWKDHPTFVNDMIRFLDNVIQYFIENGTANADTQIGKERLREIVGGRADGSVIDDILHKYLHPMRKAVYSATQERALGLGQMGWDTYFKNEGIYYDSREAMTATDKVSKHVHYQAVQASLDLGLERGEAPDMKGTGRRNSHVIAIAPTATNAIICNNVSASREKTYQNCYTHKTLSGSFLVKDEFLENELIKLGKNKKKVWKSILENDGSVQHLDFLSDHVKRLCMTAFEVDQRWVVELAAAAQPYVCQAQSLNVFFMPDASKEYINYTHLLMWKRGLKTRYYLKSKALRSGMTTATDKVEKVSVSVDYSACVACEG